MNMGFNMSAIKRMWNIFGCIKQSPEPFGGDKGDGHDIYPLHMLDDTKGCREHFLAWTLRFNDALDAQQLLVALSKLLEIGDWRKLGGRLSLNV